MIRDDFLKTQINQVAGFAQAVEVEVVEVFSGLSRDGIDVENHERGAGYFIFNAEGLRETFHESGLAAPQSARKSQYLPAFEHGSDFFGERAGL